VPGTRVKIPQPSSHKRPRVIARIPDEGPAHTIFIKKIASRQDSARFLSAPTKDSTYLNFSRKNTEREEKEGFHFEFFFTGKEKKRERSRHFKRGGPALRNTVLLERRRRRRKAC
jgi:hypothetical protein